MKLETKEIIEIFYDKQKIVNNIANVMELIERYGQIQGDHHAKWVIDQIARIILEEEYEEWVKDMKYGEDGPDTYDYDEGIAP